MKKTDNKRVELKEIEPLAITPNVTTRAEAERMIVEAIDKLIENQNKIISLLLSQGKKDNQ